MKKETAAAKLNALLGITEKVEEVKTKSTGNIVGITEDEIQTFREAQGLIYFLRAPGLFTPKVCGHCGEGFMVSRKYVGYCSYTCIEKSLEELGISWSRKGEIEPDFIKDIYDGNEPLWIRSPILSRLTEMLSTVISDTTTPQSSDVTKSPKTNSGTVNPSGEQPQSLLAPSVTTPKKTATKTSSVSKKPKPVIIFTD